MTIEEFSGGYYKVDMQVQPYDGGPVIENGLYDYINRELYSRTNAPITVRVGLDGGPYFHVDSEAAVPTNVLAIPRKWMDDMMLSGGSVEVLLLKPAFSYILSQSMEQGSEFDEHNVN